MEILDTKVTKRRRRQYRVEEKEEIVRRFYESRQTQVEFAQQEGVAIWNLKNWIKKFSVKIKCAEQKIKEGKGKGFVEVGCESMGMEGGSYEYRIVYDNRRGWIEVGRGFCIEEVRSLYAMIREEGK